MFENLRILQRIFLSVLSNKRNLFTFILAIFISQLAVATTIFLPIYLKNIFGKLSTETNLTIILLFILIYGPLKIINYLLKDIVEYLSANFLADTFGEAAKKYFVGITSTHPSVFLNYSTSQIEGAFLSLQMAFSGLIFNFFFHLLPHLTSFVLVSGLAFYFLGSKYVILLLVFFLVVIFQIKNSFKKFIIKNKEYGKKQLNFCSVFGNLLLNKNVIFRSNTIIEEEKRLNNYTSERNHAEADLFRFLSLQKINISLLIGAFTSLFLILAWGDFFMTGTFSFVELLVVIQCVDKFILPTNLLNTTLFTLFRNYLVFANFFKIMNNVDLIFTEEIEDDGSTIKINLDYKLQAQNLTVSFKNKQLFKNLNYTFKPKSLIAITGENGSGKSTLIETFQGLTLPSEGSVKISGIKSFELFSFEREILFSYVEQHPILFSQTIEFNLFYGHKITCVLNNEIKNFLGPKLLNNLKYWVGPSGSKLSEGEIIKIRLSNAFLKPNKFLFLDEPTVFLDTKAKDDFMAILQAQKGYKCIIIATHDPKIISLADFVINL